MYYISASFYFSRLTNQQIHLLRTNSFATVRCSCSAILQLFAFTAFILLYPEHELGHWYALFTTTASAFILKVILYTFVCYSRTETMGSSPPQCCMYSCCRLECGGAQLACQRELFTFSLDWPWPACGLSSSLSLCLSITLFLSFSLYLSLCSHHLPLCLICLHIS